MTESARHSLPNASHAVLTVPVCYDQMHRFSTKTAASIAGVDVLQLLDKPLAATLAHMEIDSKWTSENGTQTKTNKTFLVVMLNGSACEVSLVSAEGMTVRMLASAGDWKRGITRWHDRTAKRLAAEVESKLGSIVREDVNTASRLQRTVERVFDRLRTAANVSLVFKLPGGNFERKLNRERLIDWVDDLENDCESFAREVRILIRKDAATPTKNSRTVRFTCKGEEQPRLQFVEGSRLGGSNWNRLGKIDLRNCFQGRDGSDPLQLRIEVDESGLLSGTLTWLAKNKEIPIPILTNPWLDNASTHQWRDWLESLMLCNAT